MQTAIILILSICMVVWMIHNAITSGNLNKRKEYLDKYSVHLDERANNLAEWERDVFGYNHRPFEDDWEEISATYCISDADMIKFSSEEEIYQNAKKRLIHTLAYDISYKFEPKRVGNKFFYKLKVRSCDTSLSGS